MPDHSFYYQTGGLVTTERGDMTFRRGPAPQGGPWKSFKVNFNGNPDELGFFNIQVGLYMEIHGHSFYLDRERVFEIGTRLQGEAANWRAGDAELWIRQVEQSEQQWNRAQRQLLQAAEKAKDNVKK
uniref:Uncharacterized protein n=1 Tax=Sphaerodactylus townsendi TaxID=933632 RepID=A0ACB8G6Q0_9SAUR